jgi:hypothetical protein
MRSYFSRCSDRRKAEIFNGKAANVCERRNAAKVKE